MKVQCLKGFRDYLPGEMLQKERMLASVREVFEQHGYPPLMTPALEYAEVLTGKYGDEGEMLLYRFRDNGDRDVALRYDLTVPLARVLAEHGDIGRDMPLHSARFLRQALESTASLAGVDQPSPLPFEHRFDQDPRPFVSSGT